MSLLPDFRAIYGQFRTADEIKDINNSAFYKFCAFVGALIGINVVVQTTRRLR